VDDDRLMQAYQQMLAKRATNASPPPVSLDVVRELAESSRGGAREGELEQVLAHPVTRAEFHFLRDIVTNEPKAARRHVPTWAAMAAVLVIAVALPILWPGVGVDSPGPLRGGSAAFELVTPSPDESLAAGSRVAWRAVPEAASYTVELIDANGASRWQQATSDTVLVLPDSVRLDDGARYTLSVVARLSDGTTQRSIPRATTGKAGAR
jgi:hypothetical protein